MANKQGRLLRLKKRERARKLGAGCITTIGGCVFVGAELTFIDPHSLATAVVVSGAGDLRRLGSVSRAQSCVEQAFLARQSAVRVLCDVYRDFASCLHNGRGQGWFLEGTSVPPARCCASISQPFAVAIQPDGPFVTWPVFCRSRTTS